MSRTEPTTLRPDHRLPDRSALLEPGLAADCAPSAGKGPAQPPRRAAADVRTGTFLGVAGAVGLAWAILVAAQLAGSRALDHDALLGGQRVDPAHVVVFLVGWQVMVLAMMVPASVPVLRDVAARPRRLAPFLAGFALVWTAFAWLALSVDSVVHRTADLAPWLASRHLIAAGLLGFAGAVTLAPITARCLSACRQWRAGTPDAATLKRHIHLADGVRYGTLCLGCDGALMLLVFGLGRGNVAWMAVAGVAMAAMRTDRLAGSLHQWVGAVLVAAAAAVVAAGLL